MIRTSATPVRAALLVALSVLPASARAQDPALVEALAPLLMLEDRREFDPRVLSEALEHPEAQVRRTAAVAIGRIGQPDGVLLLIPRLQDAEPSVVADVVFALGLLRDRRGVGPILDRLRATDTLDVATVQEAAIALTRIGGPEALTAITDVLTGSGGAVSRERRDAMLLLAIRDSWRFGAQAPVDALLPYARDNDTDRRWHALYALGRLRAPGAGEVMLSATRDRVALVRETVARSLSKAFADTSGLGAETVVAELRRAINDPEAGVRINALSALATFEDSAQADVVLPLLNDVDRNVRVAAATTLGALGGSVAVDGLASVFAMDDAGRALEQAALAGLAEQDPAVFRRHAGAWREGADPLGRALAVQWLGRTGDATEAEFRPALTDRDPRVRAAALAAWSAQGPDGTVGAASAARTALRDADPMVRRAAIGALDPAGDPGDIDLMIALWADADNETRAAVIRKLGEVSRAQPGLVETFASPTRRVLLDRPDDPGLRAAALRSFPALGQRWGPAAPIETGRSLEDYRGLVRMFTLAPRNPRVMVEVEGRGNIEIELLASEAPLTVANFLQLVDRRYFDGNRWHRVVPNFVVQDGDRTGLGNGGPGWSIRDEINRREYIIPMVGMALSGPNTGGSQWFINLSPQPHLNGLYTIFGRVVGSYVPLRRVLQGDIIRSISR